MIRASIFQWLIWWNTEISLNEDTIKLIWQVLPKEVWDYILHWKNLPNGSAGKMLRNIDTDTAWDQHEAGRVF